MKKVTSFLVIVMAVFSLNTVFAQSGARVQNAKAKIQSVRNETPSQRAKSYTDTLKSILSLSDEQYQKVLAINTDFITQRDALRKSKVTDTTGQVKAQMKTIKQDRNAKIKAVLTTEQQAKWAAWKKEKAASLKSGKDSGDAKNDSDGM